MTYVYDTNFEDLNLVKKGKVRDIYDLGDKLLFVATDRISAFDVVMNEPIPGKGSILSKISSFWFEKTREIVPNHFITDKIEEYPDALRKYAAELDGRSMIVKKCRPAAIECIVRGYITGSGWKEYLNTGAICGIDLPKDLVEFQKLPEPIFTPSTKADEGHDENINFERAADIVGIDVANELKRISIELYRFGADYLYERNIVLADTKFEFGIDENGNVTLIDEVMTPDSSRFWLKENYAPGKKQTNFDKQVLRDYLLGLDWDKTSPAPKLPEEIIQKTLDKYREAYRRITS